MSQGGRNREAPRLSIAYLFLEPYVEGHGAYAHASEIIGNLEAEGHAVTLFAQRYRLGVDLPSAPGRLWNILRAQLRMLRGARRADVYYVRSHFAAFPICLWARLSGRVVVQEINGPFDDVFHHWPGWRGLKRLVVAAWWAQIRWADGIVAVTPQLGAMVTRRFPGARVTVVSNGANADLFTPSRTRRPDLPGRYVTFCGFFSVWQGIDTLLAAVDEPAWPEDVTLVLVGTGPELPRVQAAAREAERIAYLGLFPYEEIGSVLSHALCVIVPTTNLKGRADTGLAPIKLFEALASGTPVVATELPYQAEIVRDHAVGQVVPPKDPAALAAAVRRFRKMPESEHAAYRARARTAAVEHFSWRRHAQATADFLRAILAEKKP